MTTFATGAGAALLALATLAAPAQAQPAEAASAEERIQRLENHLQEVMQEIGRLKEEIAQARDNGATGQQHLQQLQGQVNETQATARQAQAQAERASQQAHETKAVGAAAESFVRAGPGLVLEDPAGRWRLQPSVKVQADYRALAPDYTSADGFLIRRARIGLGATFFSDYTVYLEEDFANQNTNPSTSYPTPITTYAYGEWSHFKSARVRVGQFKPYFGLDNTVQDVNTDFLERGLQQSLLQNLTYDRGVMVFGAPGLPGFYYSAALTNGSGQGTDRPQGNLQETQTGGHEYTVRFTENLAEPLKLDGAVIHLGVSAKRGAGVNSGANPYRAATEQTEARGLTFFIPAFFNSAGESSSNIERTITNLEEALAWGPVKLQAEYTRARYEGTRSSPGNALSYSRDLKAGYATFGWLLTGEHYANFYKDGVFSRPIPRKNFTPGESGFGLWELDVRYSWFDGSDFNGRNAANTGQLGTSTSFPQITAGTDAAHAVTLGLRWMPNPNARIIFNWVRTQFRTPVTVNGHSTDYENALETRFQLDF